MVFPDFSAEVQKKRPHFTKAKKQLRIRHIYAMLFLARLQLVGEDKAYFFDAPDAIFVWLKDQDAPDQVPA